MLSTVIIQPVDMVKVRIQLGDKGNPVRPARRALSRQPSLRNFVAGMESRAPCFCPRPQSLRAAVRTASQRCHPDQQKPLRPLLDPPPNRAPPRRASPLRRLPSPRA